MNSLYLIMVKRNLYFKHLYLLMVNVHRLKFPARVDHGLRSLSVSSPCSWLSELWLGIQESQRHSMENFCSAKPVTAEQVTMEASINYRK